MNEREFIKQAREILQRFDNMEIVGPGWSKTGRGKFMFNPEVAGGSIGGGGGGGGGPTPGTGACCYCDGTCSVVSSGYCGATGGTYQGDDSVCDPNPCNVTGACCVDEDCSITSEEDCEGTYQGDCLTCDPNPCVLPDCTCGFEAFDGSGRLFLTYTRTVTGSFEFDDTAGGGRTETGSATSEYESHMDIDCNEVIDTYTASSQRDGGIDSGDPCSDVDTVDCFCFTSGPLPQGLCTGFFEYCQFCVPALSPFPASDSTVSTATTKTRTVDLSGSCGGAGGYTCTASGSYVVEETLSNECNPI